MLIILCLSNLAWVYVCLRLMMQNKQLKYDVLDRRLGCPCKKHGEVMEGLEHDVRQKKVLINELIDEINRLKPDEVDSDVKRN